jgi:transposase-like protein
MTQEHAEGAPRGTLAPAFGRTGNGRERGRFSAQRKMEAVLRVLHGEPLDVVSRELGVTGGTLTGWRDRFLAGAQTALKSRPADERDEEIQRLRAKVGEITMANELLLERCHELERGHPLGLRRLRS